LKSGEKIPRAEEKGLGSRGRNLMSIGGGAPKEYPENKKGEKVVQDLKKNIRNKPVGKKREKFECERLVGREINQPEKGQAFSEESPRALEGREKPWKKKSRGGCFVLHKQKRLLSENNHEKSGNSHGVAGDEMMEPLKTNGITLNNVYTEAKRVESGGE